MLIDPQVTRDTLVIRVGGELDLRVAEEFRTRLDNLIDEYESKHLILDLQQVTFIDSSGLGAILGRYKKIANVGGTVAISGARPAVSRILELSGIMRIISVYPSEAEALQGR